MADLFAVGLIFFLLFYGIMWMLFGKKTNEVIGQIFVWTIKGIFVLLLTLLRLVLYTIAAILDAIFHTRRRE